MGEILSDFQRVHEGIRLRFNKKVDGIPYDGKYIFSEMGYNFLPSELSAAFALVQLKKLNKNISLRERNFLSLKKFFSKFNNIFDLPDQNKDIKTGWLAYPIILKDKLKFLKKGFTNLFRKKKYSNANYFYWKYFKTTYNEKKEI